MKPSLNHQAWLRIAEEGLRPLAALMQPGKAELPLLGTASNHGTQADREVEPAGEYGATAEHLVQVEVLLAFSSR